MTQFRVDVIVNPATAQPGVRKVEQQLGRVEKKAASLGGTLRKTLLLFGGGTLLLSSIRSLARFEQSMATVAAVTGATGEEFEILRDKVKQLGITTRFTATQTADALVNLSRAGFSTAESLASIEGVLALAQAGGLELAEAADIAASALRGFRLEAEESGRVTDVLTLAANSANTTVGQLGQAIKFVAPVAAGLKLSIEGTSAALGVLSDAGLKATLAGTGLRRVLAELESPGTKLRAVLREAGKALEDIAPSSVGLTQSLQELRDIGLDTGDALELFGQRGGPAFEVLVNNIPRIARFTEKLDGAAGTAKRVATIMDDNLNGALLRVKSAWEGLIISFGDTAATNPLTAAMNGLAASLRFAADNADALVISLTALNPALTPLIPLIARLMVLRDENKSIAKSFEQIEESAKFGKLGTDIAVATRELNKLQRIIEEQAARGVGATDLQIERMEKLRTAVAGARGEIKEQAAIQKELNDAEAAQATTVENTLLRLDRKAKLLQTNAKESEIQLQLQEEIDKLLAARVAGKALQDAREEIEARLERNQALADQKKALEDIKGPQAQAARDQAALNALLEDGKITAEEYSAAIDQVAGSLIEAVGTDPFAESLQSLQEQNELLTIQIALGEQAADARAIEQSLGRQFTDEEREAVEKLIDSNESLNLVLDERAQLERAATRASRREERLLNQVNLVKRLAEQEAALIALRSDPSTSVEAIGEIDKALEELTLRQLDASTSLGDGVERAFLRIKQEAEDLAAVGESVVGVFADNATDALVEFAKTGKLSFKDLAASILDDLTRIIARLLIVQALNAAFGALGGGVTPGAGGLPFGGARQEGGPVQPGRSFLVGEKGPELFIPEGRGNIVPNGGAAPAAPAAPAGPTIINVMDPEFISQGIASGDSDEHILNVLERNPERVQQLTRG
jgi:TP901 family phage tail tape measure protein